MGWVVGAWGVLDNTVVLSRTEGRAPQGVQAVDQDQGASQVLPPLGYRVLHLVQTQMKLLDHVSVTVPDLSRPRHQEVVRRLPHGLWADGEMDS